jgi:hypothetical protein
MEIKLVIPVSTFKQFNNNSIEVNGVKLNFSIKTQRLKESILFSLDETITISFFQYQEK